MNEKDCIIKADAEPVRIAFFGFYGRKNFGDDLFGYLLQSFCTINGGIKPMIVAGTKQRELDSVWSLSVLGNLPSRSGACGTFARFAIYCAALLRADAAVFGGGTLFGAAASLPFARFLSTFGRALRKPFHAMGTSVGPFDNTKRQQAFLSIVRSLNTIAVRDDASVALVESVRATPPNLGDLAFSLPYIYRPNREDGGRRRLVVAVHLSEYIDQTLAILQAAVLDRQIDTVCFVSLDAQSVSIAEEIEQRFDSVDLRIERVIYEQSILEIVDVLASSALVVSSKLHGGITSFVYDVPTLLFCYQVKCAEFLDGAKLPGPRSNSPSSEECVATARALLTGASKMPPYGDARAHAHFAAFSRFIADIVATARASA